jgi:hypothetical protein
MASSVLRFLDHTQWRTTVGRTPLDEWSARRRELYLTTHNTYNRKTSMFPAGFESTVTAVQRPQIYILDRATTGTGERLITLQKSYVYNVYPRVVAPSAVRIVCLLVWTKDVVQYIHPKSPFRDSFSNLLISIPQISVSESVKCATQKRARAWRMKEQFFM